VRPVRRAIRCHRGSELGRVGGVAPFHGVVQHDTVDVVGPAGCEVQMLSQVRDLGIVRDLSVGCVVKMNAFK
jgi:hypothetical protein